MRISDWSSDVCSSDLVVAENLALEDPHLDPAHAIGGVGGRFGIVDIGAQRVQRHPAFAIPFGAPDFRAAETAGAVDADAFGAQPHRRLNGALHGTAERHAAYELVGNSLADARPEERPEGEEWVGKGRS